MLGRKYTTYTTSNDTEQLFSRQIFGDLKRVSGNCHQKTFDQMLCWRNASTVVLLGRLAVHDPLLSLTLFLSFFLSPSALQRKQTRHWKQRKRKKRRRRRSKRKVSPRIGTKPVCLVSFVTRFHIEPNYTDKKNKAGSEILKIPQAQKTARQPPVNDSIMIWITLCTHHAVFIICVCQTKCLHPC